MNGWAKPAPKSGANYANFAVGARNIGDPGKLSARKFSPELPELKARPTPPPGGLFFPPQAKRSALAPLAVDKALSEHLNGGGGKLDARQFPPVPFEMQTYAPGVFAIAQAKQKLDRLYQ